MIERGSRLSEKWRRYPSDVLPMFVAEMDFALSEAIARTLHDAVDRSDTGYAWPKDLGRIFSRYAVEAFDWAVAPERVTTVVDVMTGIAETLRALTHPGDGVVVMPPVYPPFFEVITMTERTVVEVPLAFSDGYAIDWDALEGALRDGARAMLLCHPHNPVGRVFSREELERLASLAKRYDTLVISDEIHAPLVYAGNRHVPFLKVAEPLGIDAVGLMSASKGWNIAGLKCAQLIAGNERIARRFAALPHDVRDRIGHFGVLATIAAYEGSAQWMRDTLQALDGNRRLLGELLAVQLPHVGYRMPDATYLAWLDFRAYGLGDDPAKTLLKLGKVALARGIYFGRAGRGFARLNFATSPELVREGISRIASAIAASHR